MGKSNPSEIWMDYDQTLLNAGMCKMISIDAVSPLARGTQILLERPGF
jgi:hypothetical protein